MKTTIIGAGSMGSAFVRRLSRNGHEVRVVARDAGKAQVVKALNTLFAQVIAEGADLGQGQVAPTFVASDSEPAKCVAKALAQSPGFNVVVAGELRNARYLEPLAGLNICLGYGAGSGTAIAPTWISRS